MKWHDTQSCSPQQLRTRECGLSLPCIYRSAQYAVRTDVREVGCPGKTKQIRVSGTGTCSAPLNLYPPNAGLGSLSRFQQGRTNPTGGVSRVKGPYRYDSKCCVPLSIEGATRHTVQQPLAIDSGRTLSMDDGYKQTLHRSDSGRRTALTCVV